MPTPLAGARVGQRPSEDRQEQLIRNFNEWMPNLFSYGTLQQPSVQISTFGRFLEGSAARISIPSQNLADYAKIEFQKQST
jgi:hypothetical protein